MALIKSVPTDFGINAEYWNIGAVQEDFKGQGTEVTFYGYASKEAREAGKQPLSAGKVQIKKILPDLTTKETNLTGRMNSDTIIVRMIN